MTRLASIVILLTSMLLPFSAAAQQTTFYLDRLQMAGAPEDGVGIWRPRSVEGTRLYGQFGMGYSLNPFRVENYIDTIDQSQLVEQRPDHGHPVRMQLVTYSTVGVNFLRYFTAQGTFPLAVCQLNNPMLDADARIRTDVAPKSVVPMDVRLDVRVGADYLHKTRSLAFGAMFSLWVPTGDEYSFGGDTAVSGAVALAATYDSGSAAITVNTGYHFRPRSELDTNYDEAPNPRLPKFHISDELTFGVAVFVPLPVLENRLRLGAEVVGSAGIGYGTTGDVDNVPIEWRVEGRYLFGASRQYWFSGSAGTRLSAGYAPDFRGVLLVGGTYKLGPS